MAVSRSAQRAGHSLMKARDSGMPDEEMWAAFFEPGRILTQLEFEELDRVVEFGSGYGTFTVAAAARTKDTVVALDIEPAMVEATRRKARAMGLHNVQVVLRDFVAEGTGLAENSVSHALLFNILHTDQPMDLLREAHRVLRPGGRVGIIHWNYDANTPRGPALNIRPHPAQCQEWAREAGFELAMPFVDLPPYHYGLVGRKAGEK